MSNLDKINFDKSDPKKMIDSLENFPELCRKAWREAKNYSLPSYYLKAKKFVIVGMGASGISGDILKDLLYDKNIIVESVHDYTLPGWVDADTVVVACSYSGETEEVLSAAYEAHEKKAKMIVIAGGGKLKTMAEKYSIPLFLFSYASQPRAAFPYLFVYTLSVFQKLGYIEMTDSEFEKTIDALENSLSKIKASTVHANNLAKLLANKIYGKNVGIYAGGVLKSVGKRFKNQLNENAKNFSSLEIFSELNHNTIEGVKYPKNSNWFIVILESNFDSERLVKRINITADLLRDSRVPSERVKFLPCDSLIGEILTQVLFGDYVSYYLAILNNVDPSSIHNITRLKAEL